MVVTLHILADLSCRSCTRSRFKLTGFLAIARLKKSYAGSIFPNSPLLMRLPFKCRRKPIIRLYPNVTDDVIRTVTISLYMFAILWFLSVFVTLKENIQKFIYVLNLIDYRESFHLHFKALTLIKTGGKETSGC